MTKEDAIFAMLSGKKVTHRNFQPDEYITMYDYATIVTEDGYECHAAEFWSIRNDFGWNDNWSIWEG